MDLIQIKNLSFGYLPKKEILKNINLNIEESSFTCIIGENGSGKSTLLKCILGLVTGYKGKIIKEKKIGYLPQKNEIQSNFPASVEEVVLSGTISDNINSIFYKKSDKQKAKAIMEKIKVYDLRKKCFSDLSGGQQQRVLIARTLCSTDRLMILDEPTNGLDPVITNQIYKLLLNLKEKESITIIMVSHDVDKALKYANRVIELKEGKIIFDGNPLEYEKGGNK